MKKVHWSPLDGMTAYEAVTHELFKDMESTPGAAYLVQMKIKHIDEPESAYRDITELLTDERADWYEEDGLVWNNDWHEGEDDIIITAFAKVEDIDITQSFPFE